MFGKMKFRNKILLIPGLSIIVFIIVIIMLFFFTQKNEYLLSEIIGGYSPAQEMNRNLLEQLNDFEKNVDKAYLRNDVTIMEKYISQREKFLQILNSADENPVIDIDDINLLKTLIVEYIVQSREISRHVLNGEGDQIPEEIIRKNEILKNLQNAFDSNIKDASMKISHNFNLTRNNNRIMMTYIFLGILLFILMITLLSIFVIRSITKSLKIAIDITNHVTEGDLTVKVPYSIIDDEIGQMLGSFKKMVENLRNLTLQVKEGAQRLAAASGQISSSVSEIAAGATETASAANETSTTVEEVRQTANDSNQKAKNVTESSQKAVQVSQIGEKAVSETISGMHRIEEQMSTLAESITKLSKHGQDIGEIILTVEDVSEQSRLLAVNASIEAVKAGEYGKGFAVVAQEVRNLAEKSKHATTRVRSILDDIQKATSEAVMQTEQGSKAVKAGVDQSKEAGESIKKLAESVTEAAQATTQISVSSQEQLVGMDQVVSAMENIKNASNQNVAATQQVEKATTELHKFGQNLTDLLEMYKL